MKSILKIIVFGFSILLLVVLVIHAYNYEAQTSTFVEFDGERALQDVIYQVSLGPRTPGSVAHAQANLWIESELRSSGWQVEQQSGIYLEQPVQNIIAMRGTGDRWVIIGAHYDSRFFADHDTDLVNRASPVPGANDGASGVAVLLELARTIPQDLNQQIWLVFFDSEDQGHIEGWDWILGSQYFVSNLSALPDAAVIIDMIGDSNLNLPIEQNSTSELVAEIWRIGTESGYGNIFLDEPGYTMLDDHIPFLRAGIPALDIIDFDYPYWHTTEDTPDKVSATSLHVIGSTLLRWIENHN